MVVTKVKKRSSKEDIESLITVKMGDYLAPKKMQLSKKQSSLDTMHSLASKVLTLPAKKRQPSKELQQIVNKIGLNFMTLEDSINEALEVGRKEGFTDIEIGDMIREEFKRLNRPRMTLSRYLPATAKHLEKARPRPPKASGFGNILLPNTNVNANVDADESPNNKNDDDVRPITTTTAAGARAAAEEEEEEEEEEESLLQRYDKQQKEQQKEYEIMSKISLDDARFIEVNNYDEVYCRRLLKKMTPAYHDLKRRTDSLKNENLKLRKEKAAIQRHFRLCVNCEGFKKGVYDRGVRSDGSYGDYDLGWVCAKHKAQDDKLTKEFGGIAATALGIAIAEEKKQNGKRKKSIT
jgi:hypothetical protein